MELGIQLVEVQQEKGDDETLPGVPVDGLLADLLLNDGIEIP